MRKMFTQIGVGLLLSSLGLGAMSAAELTIGSKAPAIQVEHWVQNGEGKYKPLEEFEEGKVYVIEFWATWCPPCRTAMPHISEIQEKYASKGVTVVSISDEDLETVKGFLEEQQGEKTFGEITKNYCLTTDPDRSVHKDYMEAANQNGIPTAFLVGKSGIVEWIGHPMEMDEPLEKVVAGSWDREAYAAEMKEKESLNAKIQQLIPLLREGKMDEALTMLDDMIASAKSDEVKSNLERIRTQVLLQAGDERALEPYKKMVEDNKSNAEMLNQIAWMIVQMSQGGREVSPQFIAAAVVAAEQAVALEPNNGGILDTLAHLYDLQGELDKAIETQKKAVENAGDLEDELQGFLKELEAKKKSQQ